MSSFSTTVLYLASFLLAALCMLAGIKFVFVYYGIGVFTAQLHCSILLGMWSKSE